MRCSLGNGRQRKLSSTFVHNTDTPYLLLIPRRSLLYRFFLLFFNSSRTPRGPEGDIS
jgi:hypothetical protein